MDLQHIAIRVLFTYIFLHVIVRLSGKQAVGQGHAFDFVLALVLGDLIDDCLWAEVPVSQFAVAACTLVVIDVNIGLLCMRNEMFARIINGPASMIMRDGTPMRATLRRERMNRSELEELLRMEGIEPEKWPQVKSAWIDGHGRPAILPHEWARPAQKKDRENLMKALK